MYVYVPDIVPSVHVRISEIASQEAAAALWYAFPVNPFATDPHGVPVHPPVHGAQFSVSAQAPPQLLHEAGAPPSPSPMHVRERVLVPPHDALHADQGVQAL